MDSQQMMELLLKEMRAWGEKMDEYQAKTDAVLLAMQVMETSHREMVAEATPERILETLACQEMEARQEEEKPTSLDRKPEAAEERQVPEENAEVIPVGEPRKKRRKDREVAA
jgi:hypothetical protein